MKRINVYLTEQQIAALQQWSHETGLKFAELLRRVIDDALEDRRERTQKAQISQT